MMMTLIKVKRINKGRHGLPLGFRKSAPAMTSCFSCLSGMRYRAISAHADLGLRNGKPQKCGPD